MARQTPPLNAYGTYVLKAPWSTVAGIAYRCISLRKVEEIVKSKRDIYQTFYKPMKLTEEDANADILQGVVFVGLLGSDGSRIYVPDTYIIGYPDQSAVVFDYTVLTVDLGPQPSNLDLTVLIDEVKRVSADFTAIEMDNIDIHLGRAQSNKVVTQEEYQAIDEARRLQLENRLSTESLLAQKDETIRTQATLINELLTQIEEMKK